MQAARRRDARSRGVAVALTFRNLAITPDAPVSQWPTEAVQAALERGDLADWHRIVAEVRAGPWGGTARQVEEVLGQAVERSGLSQAAFASRIGTSASRLSTYMSGKVTPSATLMLRIRRVAGRLGAC